MTTIITISIAVAAAAFAASAAYLLCASRKNSLEKELAGKDAEIGSLKARIEMQDEAHETAQHLAGALKDE